MIPRYSDTIPAHILIAELKISPEDAAKISAVLANGLSEDGGDCPKTRAWVRACYHTHDLDSHEVKIVACDELLDTCGVESISTSDDPSYTDEGIRFCPSFSYCNAGDTYIATIMRDHENGAWMIASWGDALEEYEEAHEIGDFEVFDECPDRCVSCYSHNVQPEFFRHSSRGPSFSWVCQSCNHHHFAPFGPTIKIGETPDYETIEISAIADGTFTVFCNGGAAESDFASPTLALSWAKDNLE